MTEEGMCISIKKHWECWNSFPKSWSWNMRTNRHFLGSFQAKKNHVLFVSFGRANSECRSLWMIWPWHLWRDSGMWGRASRSRRAVLRSLDGDLEDAFFVIPDMFHPHLPGHMVWSVKGDVFSFEEVILF